MTDNRKSVNGSAYGWFNYCTCLGQIETLYIGFRKEQKVQGPGVATKANEDEKLMFCRG